MSALFNVLLAVTRIYLALANIHIITVIQILCFVRVRTKLLFSIDEQADLFPQIAQNLVSSQILKLITISAIFQ